MSFYWDNKFIQHLTNENINTIFEVGSRYGDETIKLKNTFPNSKIYSFECNPLTIKICKEKLKDKKDIYFFDFGLGDKNELKPFYSYTKNCDGASSFLKRIDSNYTQKITGTIKITKIKDIMNEYNIDKIDLLCMDVQGYELNVLKGSEEYIKNIKYIIMEQPKKVINTRFLPKNVHSKYIGAPNSKEIQTFMNKNGFIEIERIQENDIEDNVMYKNLI